MGLFDKVLKDVTKGIQDAVNNAVEDQAKEAVDKAAAAITDKAAEETARSAEAVASQADEMPSAEEFSKAMQGLKDSIGEMNAALAEAEEATKDISPEQWDQATATLERMANDKMKKMRLCLACDEAFDIKNDFCPRCGAKLSEKSIMELGACSGCGQQNPPGTDFCTGCGAKLPYKKLKEDFQREKDDKVLAGWPSKLPQFPVWPCGGTDLELTELEEGRFYFSAWFEKDEEGAKQSVERYRGILKENGFRTAGMYPDDHHLYKKAGGACLHADTEHCFEGGGDSPSVYFALDDEPMGGFDYVKPEPKKKPGNPFGKLFG